MAGKVFQGAEGFLGHSGSTSSGGYLDNWKEAGEVDVVLHPRGSIAALWIHRWHRIGEDKEKKPKLMPMRFNSMEDEKLLKKQHFRNGDGTREYPPVICPFSLTLEWVREQIEDGHIDWTDEIFKFETPKDDAIIHAGGFVGLFQDRKLTDDQLAELKKAKIVKSEAYKEDSRAGLRYLFQVVKYEAPDEGCVTALEGKALGQKMQKAIRDEKTKWPKEPDRGDPFVNPYVFRWKFDDEQDFEKKYDVIAMPNESLPITDEIQEVLDDDPPSIELLIEPSNVMLLKQSFQDHWCHEVEPPWDELFAKAEEAVKGTKAGEQPGIAYDEGANVDKKKAEAKASKGRTETVSKKADPKPKPPPAEEEEEVGCDLCQHPMKITEFTCSNCKAEYDPKTGKLIEKKPEPPKEEAPKRSRSSAKSDTAATGEGVETSKPKRRG